MRAQQDGIIPMAIGVGLCTAMVSSLARTRALTADLEFSAREQRFSASPSHAAGCGPVEPVSIVTMSWTDLSVSLILMAVDQRLTILTPKLGDVFNQDTVSFSRRSSLTGRHTYIRHTSPFPSPRSSVRPTLVFAHGDCGAGSGMLPHRSQSSRRYPSSSDSSTLYGPTWALHCDPTCKEKT